MAGNETDFLEHELMAGKTGGAEGGALPEFQQDFGPSMWSGQLNHTQDLQATNTQMNDKWRRMDKRSKKGQQQQHQRIGILTVAAPASSHIMTNGSSLTAANYFALMNHQRYAQLHNYRFFPVFSHQDETVSPSFTKISSALGYFDLYPDMEWLWLLDLDAFIMNKSISLEEHILSQIPDYANDQLSCIIAKDENGINSGSFLLRNTKFTTWFLQRIWDERHESDVENYEIWGEQAILNHVIQSFEKNFTKLGQSPILYVPQRLFNSYWSNPKLERKESAGFEAIAAEPNECASCPSAWKPVCDAEDEEAAATAATYGNACFAGCNGVELPVRLGGNCKSLAGCVCTQQFAPVCGADGITYGNAGCADCANVPAVSDGECTDNDDEVDPNTHDGECTVDDYDDDGKEDPDPKEIIPDANKNDRNPPCSDGDDKGACDCEDVIDIVCGADGTTYSNGCLADCSGTEVAAAGPCGADLDACDVCEDNKDQWSPVCLISSKKSRSRTHGHGRGRKLAHKESKSSMTKSYSNPCYASCEGGAGKKDGLYQGECQSQCDDKCAKESMEPMCCSDGEEYPSYKEYPNKCYASCLGGMNGRKTKKMCSRGKCAGKEAVSLLESTPCIPGGAVVRCFADPCSVTSCKADSSALCVSTYCEKFYGSANAVTWDLTNRTTSEFLNAQPRDHVAPFSEEAQTCLCESANAVTWDLTNRTTSEFLNAQPRDHVAPLFRGSPDLLV
eukprot:gene22365-29467_t